MVTKNVTLQWNPVQSFVLKDSDDFPVRMKKPDGVSASDLLPMSLIGCVAYDVVEILQKQRQDVRELRITAESTQDDDPPWRFRQIRVLFQAIGSGLDPEKLRKAIHLTEEKYCAVYSTLREVVEITNEIEIVEA